MRERDRDDLVLVLPNHVLHVDRDAAEAGVAAGLLGTAENRFDVSERHAGLDLAVAIPGDGVAAAAAKSRVQVGNIRRLKGCMWKIFLGVVL